MELKKEGKVRAIGSSNVEPHNVEKYLAAGCEIDIIQRKYSILERTVEANILPLCKKYGISFHAYSPLERGLLTGKIKSDYTYDAQDARVGQPWWAPERRQFALEFVNSLTDICEKYDCTQIELSIAFLLGQSDFINVICGAHRPKQIEADVPATEITICAEDLQEIKRRVEKLEANHPAEIL
jgi:methylglyoxal reductase